MFKIKTHLKEIYGRISALEVENQKLEKRLSEAEKGLNCGGTEKEYENSDTPSGRQILDEWLNGKA